MSKSSNQKLKLLHMIKILQEKTDETHSITMQDIGMFDGEEQNVKLLVGMIWSE